MKKVVLALLLVPMFIMAQESAQEPIFLNVMLTPHSDKIQEFEKGIAEYNKKYHTSLGEAASVFWIATGKNSGKYVWSMATSWDRLDGDAQSANRMAEWNTNVAPYAEATMETTIWKGDMAHSNFTKDFTLKNMAVFMLDMKRFKNRELMGVLGKVHKVFKTKDPDGQWGVYWNQLANNDGQDMVWIDFFDSMSWMGENDQFPQWYEEVYGEGTFLEFVNEFEAATDGDSQEIWMFRPDLSGAVGKVTAIAARE